jgi:hypothetical protein
MKAFRALLLLCLALAGADPFTTKKRERRPAFKSAAVAKDATEAMEEPQQAPSATTSNNNGPMMFAFPPGTMAAAVPVHNYEVEDEVDVSYGAALVSCVLSLALGFGLGYGT